MAFPHDGKKMKKGETLNPHGRPKKIPELEVLLAGKPDSEYQNVINALFKQAKKGNVRAAEVLLDRAYGRVKQDLNVHTDAFKDYTIVPASKEINSQ
jgi:hypothetical protein